MGTNGTILWPKHGPDLAQRPFRGHKLRQSFPGRQSAATKVSHRASSVAVDVGLKTPEKFRLFNLSTRAAPATRRLPHPPAYPDRSGSIHLSSSPLPAAPQ